ncbi:MAG: NrdH-redoxin [Anaerolineae bacterium]|jgi:glutaredoxin-like protein|nr:NrdH-redoxin [Anaerolineae bacterium]MBT7073261.1 NrdH-redoxin [Anaerolineae bacterium]MBT7325323.1 NrdH-redoxin [Anaerolineae bacterium]
MPDLYSTSPTTIVMYSTVWCPDCQRAKKFLDKEKVTYINVDIDKDEKGRAFVMEMNNGARVVPTIIFPDGEKLTEPSTQELRAKLA